MDGQGSALTEPWTAMLAEPLAPGAHQRWDAFAAFAPAYEHLASLSESHRATVTVTVSRSWGQDIRLPVAVQVLAYNEWLNSPLFFESLAAFVQPNTSAVASVLDRASALLREHTDDAGLAGYQQGRERASQIAAAVYEALRAHDIRYVIPPASFEDTGQKVRTTREVLDQRFGTCIDLAVTYAACIEQAGLYPLLWLIDGHAFAGYLSDGGSVGSAVVTEANMMINLVESGRAIPVEAKYFDQGPSGTFAAAVGIGKSHFTEPSALRGVIDIHATHRAGTRPLPGEDPRIQPGRSEPDPHAGSDRGQLELPDELLSHPDESNVLLEATDHAPPRVRQWKRALLDLSTSNRLLNLRASSEVVDLHVPSGALGLLDDMVHNSGAIALLPQDELSDLQRLQGARRAQDLDVEPVTRLLQEDHTVYASVTSQAYVARMRKLQRSARTLLEETGNANLYLTVGALIHRTPSGNEARAPLFLLPVRIEGGSGRSPFEFRMDTTSVASPNHCLIEWLRIKHRVSIEALQTPPLDQSGIDIGAALPAIRQALLAQRLDVRIDEVASIAICQFSTFGMWRDLKHSWEILSRNRVVEHLALKPGETFTELAGEPASASLDDVQVQEAEVPLPIPADGSQLRAVALAGAGRSFVLEGPPGTGKSQTITNMIAHALANGKTVLFVAEKQAALQVVKRRLEQVGLGDFTLDLHGRSQRPAEIRAQLKRAIDNIAAYDERGWQAVCATLRARHAPLEEYPDRVHARNGLGVSLWGAYENLQQYGEGPAGRISASYVAGPDSEETPIRDALRDFARAARTAGLAEAHPWAIVGDPVEELDARALSSAAEELERARRLLDSQPGALALVEELEDPNSLLPLIPHLRDRAEGTVPTTAHLNALRTANWTTASREIEEELGRLWEQHAETLATFTPAYLEHGDTAALASAAQEAERGMFGKRKRAERFALTAKPLLSEGAHATPSQIPSLIIGIEAARAHANQLTKRVLKLLGELGPGSWTPLRADARDSLEQATERIARCDRFEASHPELWRLIEERGNPSSQERAALERVAATWADWQKLLGACPAELARWCAGRHWTAAWSQDCTVWSTEIADAADAPVRRWGRMVALLQPLLDAGLHEFREQLLSVAINPADGEVAYLRGVAEASLRERRSSGGLQGFDAALRDGEIEELAAATKRARHEQAVALPAGLLGQRSYRGDQLQGRPAELRRRLDAKRRGMSFRQLIENYGEEILQATPCFFVSPASLAQYVPPGAITFDLVVFDEASQVAVPQAIGALGRGHASIIVGDAQQMPPTSVAKSKLGEDDGYDEDDGTEVLEDLESILTECVESGLPRHLLSWHYRSQDESLIAFSNAYYYDGRLASFPAPGHDRGAGVEMRRVQGHFNREDTRHEFRTNRVEAEAIVAEIRRRLSDPELSDQSIGVVTFNAQQRDLVLNLLEESEDPMIARALREDTHEGIFVKNLENVQGDERDVVLFSAAFSKRPDVKALPLKFGPLGAAGGEKRLNVAITRARRKVLIFVSFDPSDIDLSRTSSRGIAHLRSYLEMAAHGPSGLPQPPARSLLGVDHVRENIAGALRDRGYEVATNYGLSDFALDIAVRAPGAGHWQVAIILDGPRWAERSTVADRELTPLLLERLMRWGALLRLWLPEWIDDPERALERVADALARAEEREEREQTERSARVAEREQTMTDACAARELDPAVADPALQDEQQEAEAVEVETFTFTSPVSASREEHAGEADSELAVAAYGEPPRSASFVAYAAPARDVDARGAWYVETDPVTLGNREDLDRTDSVAVRATVAAAVRETIETEGPIATTRLARSIGRRFGFDRVASGRQQLILREVPTHLIRRSDLGEFVWPAGVDPETWKGYRRTPEDISRPLSDVAPEEIVNAMSDVATARTFADDDELFRATLLLFGQRRLTSQTIERLTLCRKLAERRSRLIRTPDERWAAGA